MIKELKKKHPNQDRRSRQQSKKEINIEDLIEGKPKLNRSSVLDLKNNSLF